MTITKQASIKSYRKWHRMGINAMMPYVVGAKFKGMSKSNYRALQKKYKPVLEWYE